MPIITILVVLIVIGALLYLVHAVIPMDSRIRIIIDVLVLLLVLIWLLNVLGLISMGSLRLA